MLQGVCGHGQFVSSWGGAPGGLICQSAVPGTLRVCRVRLHQQPPLQGQCWAGGKPQVNCATLSLLCRGISALHDCDMCIPQPVMAASPAATDFE